MGRPDPAASPAASALLASPPFLAAVALLLLNDHLLKAAYGNWLTGKLSDFSGLFAFALFWTAFLPRRRNAVLALTGAAFLLWKSPLSQPLLDAWNALGVLPLARVVDYGDWLALLVLLPAHHLARHHAEGAPRPRPRLRRRALAVASAVVSIAAFTATSRAYPAQRYPEAGSYSVLASRAEVRAGLSQLGLLEYYVSDTGRGTDTRPDTLAVRLVLRPDRRIWLRLELRDGDADDTVLRPLQAHGPGLPRDPEQVEAAFVEQVFTPLRDLIAARRRPAR